MKNKEILNISHIEDIIKRCQYCNVAMVDERGEPYVVPMNFGYSGRIFYLHSSKVGRKMEILKNNNRVCLSLSTDHELRWQSEQVACSYSMRYRSVLVYGKVEFIEEPELKIEALNCIMRQYSSAEFNYSAPSLRDVAVYKIVSDKMDGREYGY